MNAGLATGATMVLLPRFDAGQALALMEREQVTFFAGVPTMYHALLHCQDAPDIAAIAARLRVAVSGGAALPAELMRRFEERFGVPILEGYGLSETSPVATFNRVDRPRRPGSVGLPVWGVQVKIIADDGGEAAEGEPGEIAIRGHNVMKGYFRRSSATAVVGVPHPSHGEEVKAFVVRVSGAGLTEAELIAWCKQNMAAYKYPRIVEFRDSLPMTATGKILKRELARAAGADEARPAGARP
jgi:long-chain acyl-CoA synthetase